MTGPQLQPCQCRGCGQPVLPAGYGIWMDQPGGRFCHANPATPHVGGGPLTPGQLRSLGGKPQRGKVIGIVVAVVATVALVTGVTVVIVASQHGSAGTAAGAATSSQAPAPTATTAPQPGASVPCDPDSPRGRWCFPADTKGADMIQRLTSDLKWPCYSHGDPKAPIDADADHVAQVCLAKDNKSQNYTWFQSIGYDTESPTHDPALAMRTVQITSGVSYTQGKEQAVGPAEAEALADKAFKNAIVLLWPDNKDFQNQATEAFTQVKQRCDSERGGMTSQGKASMALGYRITCSPAGTISSTNRDGNPFSVTSTGATIEAVNPAEGTQPPPATR